MSERLKRYVNNIVNQTECAKEDREDLFEELFVHLEQRTEDYQAEGLTKEEAENRAISDFGHENIVGNELQQAMFPYRKILMMYLSILSFITGISIYLFQLFIEGYAAFVWISMVILISTCLLYLSINISVWFNHRRWINSLLIIHSLLFLYGWLLASNIAHSVDIGLIILNWLVLALSLLLIYRTTLFGGSFINEKKDKKILHGMNITSGIVIIGATLFFVLGGLIMIGTFHPRMIIFTIPFIIWLLLYIFQMKLIKKNRFLAYLLGGIPLFVSLAIVFYFFGMPLVG